MVCPLTKTTIIKLANDIISGRELEEEMFNCKKLHKLKSNENLGIAWHRGF
jgi:hypothetical protein